MDAKKQKIRDLYESQSLIKYPTNNDEWQFLKND